MAQWVALAIAASSAGFQVSEAEAGKKRARKAAGEQRKRQESLQRDIQSRQAEEESQETATRTRQQARRRQRALAAEAGGRRGTIATSPLGQPGQATAATTAKTLLGS